mgnify:CR=1 FL=1
MREQGSRRGGHGGGAGDPDAEEVEEVKTKLGAREALVDIGLRQGDARAGGHLEAELSKLDLVLNDGFFLKYTGLLGVGL